MCKFVSATHKNKNHMGNPKKDWVSNGYIWLVVLAVTNSNISTAGAWKPEL